MLQPLVEFPDFLVNSVFHERLVGEVGHPSMLRRKGNALATVTPPPPTESPMTMTNPPRPYDANTGGGIPPLAGERVTSGASERNVKWSLPGRIEEIEQCRGETKGCHKLVGLLTSEGHAPTYGGNRGSFHLLDWTRYGIPWRSYE